MGVEGDKGPSGLLRHFSGQIVRQPLQPLPSFHKGLQGQSGQAYPGILRGLFLRQPGALQFYALLPEPAVPVRAGNGEGRHPVPNSGDTLIAEELRLHRHAVQRPSHDLEGAQAALRRPVAEGRVHGQKAQEVSLCHSLGDLPVKLRPLRGEAVGAILPQLVGQVSAGNEHSPAPQGLHRLSDTLPQPVVVHRREPGQADAEDRAVRPGLPQEVQRYKGPVVQRRVPLTQRPGPETGGLRTADDLVPQRGVVLYTQFGLGRTEGGHVSSGTPAW